VSASTNERHFLEDEHPSGTTNNGWVQIGIHTRARVIVQGGQLEAARYVARDWGGWSISWTIWPWHSELFSRGALWSHANPCPTAPPPNAQHPLICGREAGRLQDA
jgi:hypothetical protein